MNCHVIPPQQPRDDVRECGKPARWVITFKDGDKVSACDSCLVYLGELARSHGTTNTVEKV